MDEYASDKSDDEAQSNVPVNDRAQSGAEFIHDKKSNASSMKIKLLKKNPATVKELAAANHKSLSREIASLQMTGIQHVKVPNSTMRYSVQPN